jgi:hypothetical protein
MYSRHTAKRIVESIMCDLAVQFASKNMDR